MLMEEKNDYLDNDYSKIELDLECINTVKNFKFEINQHLENAINEMNELENKINKEDKKNLIEQCRESIVNTIIGQFGLASLIITSQDGGNVTTTHNFEKGIVVSEDDRKKYQEWQNNQKDDWKTIRKEAGYDDSFNSKRKEYFKLNGKIYDEYTGKELNKDGRTHLDHVISASEIEKNAKNNLFLSQEERAKMATDDANLAFTEASLNQSKSDRDLKDWMHDTKRGKEQTNAQRYGVNEEKAMKKYNTAQKHVSKTVNTAAFKKYSKELILTGGKDAGKMIAYSAIGIILKEVVEALIFEIKYTIKNYHKESIKEIFIRFKNRAINVFERIKNKWKDILCNSFESGIMAFISNVVVFIINLFATTLKRIVSMIRATFVSLVQALKIVINPPKDMPKEEVYFQAIKVFAAGIIGAMSLMLTEGIEKLLLSVPGLNGLMVFIVPVINESIGTILSTTLSAICASVLTTIAFYYLDKIHQKDSTLHLQLMTASGVVVEYKVMQSWIVMQEAYEFLGDSVNEMSEYFNELSNDIKDIADETNKKITSDFDEVKNKLKLLYKDI